ncbi:MAG: hypothetical protein JW815_02760 [Candidatus Bathyarchaeota archaeon]|nr:hypothetical protein [Candidatus Bathyarchaeum sp.]
MKQYGRTSKLLVLFVSAILLTVSFTSASSKSLQPETFDTDPNYFMGMLILESEQEQILNSIRTMKELQLGNLAILHPMDQGWDLTLVEEAISVAESLGIYTMFEPFNFSDHEIRISPDQFAKWQAKYPHLLGIMVAEITGKQSDMSMWVDNSTGTISTRLQAEEALVETIISRMQLAEFKAKGARIFLQENVIGYAAANTSNCDVFLSKVFNAPNTELMIGLARGMQKTYNIPAWGLFVDTWREWEVPPADFTGSDVERALYEAWFYGAKYFFFEQGNFFGTLNRTGWDNKYIILDEEGNLTEFGRAIQRFYTFLQNGEKLGYEQPDYSSSIAVMIGQSGWSSRGPNWGFWDQTDRQGDFDYELLNLFFPGIGDNWQIGGALTGKEFTGLPFGMVDIISVYAPPSVLKQYKLIVGLGWSLINDTIAGNLEDYVENGGIFFSLLTFTHGNNAVDDLEDAYAWTKSYASLFGVNVSPPEASQGEITADMYLHNVTFTEDTFWYPWEGITYTYSGSEELGSWFWKFKYELSHSENTKVLAWVNNIQTEHNAFIIENKKGSGYTYIVNTRNPKSLPHGVLTDVLTEFIHFLCAYYVRPMVYVPYPEEEYWLNQGQADRAVYLLHDNSTSTETLTYYVRALDTTLNINKNYIIFEYIHNDFYWVTETITVPLEVTLAPDEAKLFLLLENDDAPRVLSSDAILTDNPSLNDSRFTVFLNGIEQATNITKIYCAEFDRPSYILGTQFNLTQSYNPKNKVLTFVSASNFTAGWENTTDVYVTQSSVPLTDVSWNETRGTLNVFANGSGGQKASIQLQTGGAVPYYFMVDGSEKSTWSYDTSTGILSATFLLSNEPLELVFGFKQIEVDVLYISDSRVDVGSVQTVGFHVQWMCNHTDIEGAAVEVNGVEYLANQTGWATFDVTYDGVGIRVWNVTGVEYEDITDYAKSIIDPSIIWDRIKITDRSVIDSVVEADSSKTLWLTAEYEYDSKVFNEVAGTIFLDNKPMTWSSSHSRWEYTATADALGSQVYEASSVEDERFGLNAINNQDMSVDVTWDKIEIRKTEFETNSLGVTNTRVQVAYDYTMNPVVDATVIVNGRTCNQIEEGVYACELNYWGSFQNLLVEVDTPDFEQATLISTNIHVANTILYVAIVSAIVLLAAVVVLKKKRNKKTETAS